MNRLWGLQLQNSIAGVISKTKQYTSMMPIPDELRWPLINKRCQFKILLLIFKLFNSCAPEYLCDMLNVCIPIRFLLSTAFTSLVPNRNRYMELENVSFELLHIHCGINYHEIFRVPYP